MSLLKTDKMAAHKDKHVGWITFNNPARHNAVSLEMWQGLADIANDFARDDDIRVVVVLGAGDKAFVSGADISEFAEQRDSAQATRHYDEVAERGTQALKKLNKPTLAMIQGYCIGGGVAVALNCDIRIAADNARFGQPEIKLGIIPGAGGTQRLPRAIGKAKAMDLALTGRLMDATEAERCGLVARVVPNEKLLQEALEAATIIASFSTPAVMMVKEAVNRSFESSLDEGLLFERRMFHSLFATTDQKEGMNAFLEKRPARFSNE
jgi:enoyl-CoA hydratase